MNAIDIRAALRVIADEIERGNHRSAADKVAALVDSLPPATDALATETVGKLLGAHAITEWYIEPDWYQARIAQDGHGMVRRADLRWRHEDARSWSTWRQPWGDPSQHMDVPGRHVPADQADADPATRGPLPKGG